MSSLARQLKWLIAIRLVMITSVALPYFLLQIGPSETPALEGEPPGVIVAEAAINDAVPGRWLFTIAGITYLATIGYIALQRILRGREETQAYIQFFGDLLLVTFLVWAFGGIQSPFSIIYLLVIAVASTLVKKRASVVATLAFSLYAGLQLALYKGWIATPDGSVIQNDPVILRRLFYNLAVHLFGFYGVTVLISWLTQETRKAERELAAKTSSLADLEVLYRDVIQSVTSGLLTVEPTGHVVTLNEAAKKILQRDDEVIGGHVGDLGIFDRERWQEFSSAAQHDISVRSEVQATIAGRQVFIGFSIASLRNADGDPRGSIVIFQDLTRYRQLEEEVRIKDRMAAVGSLAAGIAHEIGNPLASISGSAQMLEQAVKGDSQAEKLLSILLKESERLNRTIQTVLEYARPKERGSMTFDVSRLLADNFALLENSPEVKDDHHLRLEVDPPSASIIGDPDQVSQVFWNLARNSLKAMPAGGALTVRGELQGALYRIVVKDTGKGMSEEERANLFHPYKSFFDNGTGLGMAIVYRIVEDHRGRLRVASRPGEGTSITVELPTSDPLTRTGEFSAILEDSEQS